MMKFGILCLLALGACSAPSGFEPPSYFGPTTIYTESDIEWNPPTASSTQGTPAETYAPVLNGRNITARALAGGQLNCGPLERAWESTYDYAAAAVGRVSLAQVRTEEEMHDILDEAYYYGDVATQQNVLASKEALTLLMANGCFS